MGAGSIGPGLRAAGFAPPSSSTGPMALELELQNTATTPERRQQITAALKADTGRRSEIAAATTGARFAATPPTSREKDIERVVEEKIRRGELKTAEDVLEYKD